MDYGPEALKEMIHILNRNKIHHAGASMLLSYAKKGAVLEVSGKRIGFIALTDNEPSWEATETTPGTYYVPIHIEDLRAKELFKKIEEKTFYMMPVCVLITH